MAADVQGRWEDDRKHQALPCLIRLHPSSTSASTANANSLYVLLGGNTEKKKRKSQ